MVSRPLLVFFTSIGSVLSLRLLDGIGKGIKDPAKDVLVAGSSEKKVRGRSFGIARMLDTLGSVVGPLMLFVLLYIFKDSPTLYHNIKFQQREKHFLNQHQNDQLGDLIHLIL